MRHRRGLSNLTSLAPQPAERAFSAFRAYLPGWLVVLGCLAALGVAEWQNRVIHQQAQRAEVQEAAGLIHAQLEGVVTADIQLARGIVAIVEEQPDMDQAEYSSIAARTIGDNDHFLNIAVAPDLVVELVHPLEPNRAVLGFDLHDNAAQRDAAFRVRDSGRMVLAGPVDLIQGGQGFIGRLPLFDGQGEDRKFRGVVSVVIDVQAVYRKAGFAPVGADLRLALRGKDGTGAGGAVFAGDPAIFDENPVLTDILLPEGSWQMAAVPVLGWTAIPPGAWYLRLFVVVIGVFVAAPTFIALQLSRHRDGVIRSLLAREKELAEQRQDLERLSAIAEHASDSIILNDDEGRITWVNEAFTEMTGYSFQDAKGKTPAELLNGPDTDPDTVARIREGVAAGRRVRAEVVNYTKAGDRIWVETTLAPILGKDGRIAFTVAVERDITAAKYHEAELAAAKHAAEKADRAKSEFLANMSHEIRTPINGIMGMSEVLQDRNLPDEPRQLVDIIHQSADSLLQIVNDILDLSRLEAGKMTISPADFDLHTCVNDAVRLMDSAAREKNLRLSVSQHRDLPRRVRGDDTRLRQVLLNLLGNAVKFTQQGQVTLRVLPDPDTPYRVRFEVQDTGVGMSAEQVSHVFDRFTQADASTTRSFGGSGLGLTISRHLVMAMGGQISVNSQEGVGSCFCFDVLIAPPLDDTATEHVSEPSKVQNLQGYRLLLAEDNRTNRMLVHLYLAETGVEIFDAADGVEAVEMFETVGPHVILMDMSMPRLDGVSATREIRAIQKPQPPIIALTANAFESDRDACLAAGMDAFLSKPLKKDILLAAIAQKLRTQDATEPAMAN